MMRSSARVCPVALGVALAAGVVGAPAASRAQVQFFRLGDLAGGIVSSEAHAVSNGGTTVVGQSDSSSGTEAFVWTEATGMVGLGDLDGGDFESRAFDVSWDGRTIVGTGEVGGGQRRGAVWRDGDPPFGIDGSSDSRGHAVSADGGVVAGFARLGYTQAFRWSADGGMEGLGELDGGDVYSAAWAISADGSAVVGGSKSARSGSNTEAFLWTRSGGMIGLGDFEGGEYRSEATAVSADGSVVAGTGTLSDIVTRSFRWTETDGLVDLGALDAGFWSRTGGMSADGDVIAGTAYSERFQGHEPFVWTGDSGMRPLADILLAGGVDVFDWFHLSVQGVSPDGTAIVGWGRNPEGIEEAWLAIIPAPGVVAVFAAAAVVVVARAKRQT